MDNLEMDWVLKTYVLLDTFLGARKEDLHMNLIILYALQFQNVSKLG